MIPEIQAEKKKWNNGNRRELPPLVFCPGTDPEYFDEDEYPLCFDEKWETQLKRRALWGAVRTALPEERRVSHILLSSVYSIVADAGPGPGMCNAPGTKKLRATLREAKAATVGAKVYALFAVNDADFSETDKVPDVVAWNEYCAKCWNEKFDGVAMNNEHFSSIKCEDDGSEEELLDRLYEAKVECENGDLELHMSIGWHWRWCSVTDGILNEIACAPPDETPVTKPANEHFIDIVDSVDARVSWNVPSTMADRAIKAGAEYAEILDKPFWVLAYTNPNGSNCRFTFFPTVGGCTSGILTEAGMWAAFDEVATSVTSVRGGIHFFRGSYGTGLPSWPRHDVPPFIPFMCAEKEKFEFSDFRHEPPASETAKNRNRGGIFQQEQTIEGNLRHNPP